MSYKYNRLLGTVAMILVMSMVLMSLMVFDTFTAFAAPSSSTSTKELESKLAQSKKDRNTLEQDIKKAEAQQRTYQTEINNLDSEIALLTEQLSLIEELELAWAEDKAEAEAEIARLEGQREREILAFESMLRTSYQYGEDTYFNLIFGSQDIGDFLSRADLISYHLKANDNIVNNLSATIGEFEAANAQYEESLSKIESYGDEKANLVTELEEKSENARLMKQKLESDEAVMRAELKKKNDEMAEMEAEIRRRYEESLKSGNIGKYEGGTFYVPTENYRISSEFANRVSPITGKRENHNGIDFAAPGGTNIYAAAGGTVIDSRYSSSWGNVIKIDHGGGLITLYAHCSYRGVTVGQTVAKGQVIARVGTTGWSTGNHLHFTVYKNGVAVNPRQYLPANI